MMTTDERFEKWREKGNMIQLILGTDIDEGYPGLFEGHSINIKCNCDTCIDRMIGMLERFKTTLLLAQLQKNIKVK